MHLRIEPLPSADFEFADELVGMSLSRSYLAPIEKGIRASLEQGVYAGYPMSNVKVIVYDGKEHPVDSKPVAFEIAGREAFKLAVHSAGPVLFEPIMTVRIVVPDDHMGDVMGDLNTRRGRVQGTESERGSTVVVAHVPLSEMLRYTSQLRSLTGGRGYFTHGTGSLRCGAVARRGTDRRCTQEGAGSPQGRVSWSTHHSGAIGVDPFPSAHMGVGAGMLISTHVAAIADSHHRARLPGLDKSEDNHIIYVEIVQ